MPSRAGYWREVSWHERCNPDSRRSSAVCSRERRQIGCFEAQSFVQATSSPRRRLHDDSHRAEQARSCVDHVAHPDDAGAGVHASLVKQLGDWGYDIRSIERVPQRW